MTNTMTMGQYTLKLLNRSQSSSIASLEIHGGDLKVVRLDLGKRIFIDLVPEEILASMDGIVEWVSPLFRENSLLTLRKESLEVALQDVLTRSDMLRGCIESGFSDTYSRIVDLEDVVRKARVLAAQVEDLQDVAKYGIGGGR